MEGEPGGPRGVDRAPLAAKLAEANGLLAEVTTGEPDRDFSAEEAEIVAWRDETVALLEEVAPDQIPFFHSDAGMTGSVARVSTLARFLLVIGGVLEFAGIMAVAWPDTRPRGGSWWPSPALRRAAVLVARARLSEHLQAHGGSDAPVQSPPRGVTVHARAGTVTMRGGRVTARASIEPGETICPSDRIRLKLLG
jgi:hypothetical protein